MRLGLSIPNFTWSPDQELLGDTFGLLVERAGLYSVWVPDHFFQSPWLGRPEQEMLEGWSALAYAAGRTNRIKLGTMVTGVTNRHPGIEEEHQGLGIPLPPLAERFARLEETLQIALQMWSGDENPYEGKYYHLARPLNSPQSIQKPHPPILVGGHSERKTLRLVARYADACNFMGYLDKDTRQHKLEVLREHCQALGRSYEQIEKTLVYLMHLTRDGRNGTFSPQAAIDCFADLAAEGFDQVIMIIPNVTDLECFDLLASNIIPEVERIPVAGR